MTVFDANNQPTVRHRVWVCRVQFFGNPLASPFGGASVLDFSTLSANGVAPTQVFCKAQPRLAGALRTTPTSVC
jgi:hypothetical protein